MNVRKRLFGSVVSLLAVVWISPANAGTWETVPLGGGGFVTGLAANATGTAIYGRTDVGGAMRWVPAADGVNGTWVSLSDEMVPFGTAGATNLMGVESIATDPSNANRVYMGAGNGIHVSDDQGETWATIRTGLYMAPNGSARTFGERLSVNPNNPNVVWYGSLSNGLQKGDKSSGAWVWSQVSGVPALTTGAGVVFVVCDKNSGNTIVYAGVNDASVGGIYRSLDAGANWAKVEGSALTGPQRAQIASNGTLYVTAGGGGVAKLPRNGTLALISSLPTGINYVGIGVDPNDAAGNTVYISEGNWNSQYNRFWRSSDGGGNWAMQQYTFNGVTASGYNQPRTEPDLTPSVTGYWFGNTAALLVTPGKPGELWAGDYFGVTRTRDAQNIGTTPGGAQWHTLQKGQEEVVAFALKTPPSGAKLLTGVGDVGGGRYNDITVRPAGTGGNVYWSPGGGNTTSLDFCESQPLTWVRGWVQNAAAWTPGAGSISYNGGVNWSPFGLLAQTSVPGGSTNTWIEWDMAPYIKQHLGGPVTLIVRSLTKDVGPLSFDSKEGANAPRLVVNGGTTLTATADVHVHDGTAAVNYGSATTLISKTIDGSNYTRWIYLKFDLTGVSSVTTAKLRMFLQASNHTDVTLAGVYANDATSWTESGLTWSSRPLFQGRANTYVCTPPDVLMNGSNGGGGGRIAISPTDPANIVWMPINYVQASIPPYYSKDGGATWAAATGAFNSPITGVYTNGNSLGMSGQCLTADRVNNKFYLGKFGGTAHQIYSSSDGATWTLASSVSNGNSANMRTPQLVAAPAAGDVWLCDDGTYKVPASGGGLWRSTNAGANFLPVSGVGRVTGVSFGKATAGSGFPYAVYIYGYAGSPAVLGVYRSDNLGATWTLLDAPTIATFGALEGDRQNASSVYLGTGGRGVFHYNSGSTTVTLVNVADAYVRDGSFAAVNYGTDPELIVKRDGSSYSRWTYLKFDLSGFTGTITSAKLRMRVVASASSATPVVVYGSNGTTWTEGNGGSDNSPTGEITWNNKPATTGTALATVTFPAATLAGNLAEWDVTSYLQAQKSAGASLVTLVLQGTVLGSNNSVNFSSAETGAIPEIKVTYTP